MNRRLYETGLRILVIARTVQACFHLLPPLGAACVIIVITRWCGFNIITVVINAVLTCWAIPSLVTACEIFTKPPPPKRDDRRALIGTGARARRESRLRQMPRHEM